VGLSVKHRDSPYVHLRHLAADILVGTTENKFSCPFCIGGANGDRGFVITRLTESEAVYCCHRATCGKAGRIACWGFRLEQILCDPTSQPKSEFTPRVYTGRTGELGQEWSTEILGLYGLTVEESYWANWRRDIGSGRLVCPILGPTGKCRGQELRKSKISSGDYGPKTIHYRQSEEVWMGWYRRSKTNPIILVEDIVSALKGSRHFQAGCLLGSHVSLDHILEATEVAKDQKIYLALDKDATDKAAHFIKKWKFVAANLVLQPLSKDLKLMTDEEIKHIKEG
jgi:hypothetical protein